MSNYSPKFPDYFKKAKFTTIIVFFVLLVSLLVLNGCTGKGDLTFNDPDDDETFSISGSIVLDEIIETDLTSSIRNSLTNISNYNTFEVAANEVSVNASEDGSYQLTGVPVSDKMLVEAISGKVRLMKRLSLNELYYTDLSDTQIDLESTVEALIWKLALDYDKNLTAADIRAREYEDMVASVTSALKLALQLNSDAIAGYVDELPAVRNPANTAAQTIIERETLLRDANDILANAFFRKDTDLLQAYISPSFSNDWDSTSNWDDFFSYYNEFFDKKAYTEIDWKIDDLEFLPDKKARVRTSVKVEVKYLPTEEILFNQDYCFDAIWRKEGTFWKVYRNLPYRQTHPTQVGADLRWGQIADAHAQLKAALAIEDLNVFEERISSIFGNDFDSTSTHTDIISVADSRFDSMDVKIASYSIDNIEFNGPDLATVECKAEVTVINLIPGVDISSGIVKAKVVWRKEDGLWKIYRNLPYKFSHVGK
ncbi:MAG: hypothetical protein ACQETH_05690 [Candidatus Rifleibacteriota bacterium]